MKLSEIKNETDHYFIDEHGMLQGEWKTWYANGHQWTRCHYRDGELHGEYKWWWWPDGKIRDHLFYNDEKIIDFLKNPELYPTTPEEKTMFALKYGIAPFITEGECK